MNFLEILAAKLCIDLTGCDTDDKKSAAIMAGLDKLQAANTQLEGLLTKIGAKTTDEAHAMLATMVSREEHTKLQNEKQTLDLQLVLLEGQMNGKLSQADCEPEKGWAWTAAKTAPGVLRAMLPNLQAKVATGSAVKAMVDGLQTVKHDAAAAAASTIAFDGKTFNLTDLTKSYGEAELANLRDMIGRFGVKAMVDQGYITE